MIFPWQNKQWQHVWRMKQDRRLPHALLVTGSVGMGKVLFAQALTRAWLCQQVDAEGNACGVCHACHLLERDVHPNVSWIKPEKEGQAIKIDQIREASDFVYHSSLENADRILLIHPADQLNAHAANALLKTLEEPPAQVVIMLITDQAQHLPATILSRCQRIHFPLPLSTEVIPWLKPQLSDENEAAFLLHLANGAPLMALALSRNETLVFRRNFLETLQRLSQQQEDPIQSAAKFQKIEPIKWIDFMLVWVMDLLRLQLGCDVKQLMNADYFSQLTALSKERSVEFHLTYMNYLQQIRQQIRNGMNLNKPLLLESALIRWRQACF